MSKKLLNRNCRQYTFDRLCCRLILTRSNILKGDVWISCTHVFRNVNIYLSPKLTKTVVNRQKTKYMRFYMYLMVCMLIPHTVAEYCLFSSHDLKVQVIYLIDISIPVLYSAFPPIHPPPPPKNCYIAVFPHIKLTTWWLFSSF